MAYRILLPQPIMESGRKYLEEKGYEIIDGEGFTEDDIIRQIPGCDDCENREDHKKDPGCGRFFKGNRETWRRF